MAEAKPNPHFNSVRNCIFMSFALIDCFCRCTHAIPLLIIEIFNPAILIVIKSVAKASRYIHFEYEYAYRQVKVCEKCR